MVWRGMRGRFHGFGTVGVRFGAPMSLAAFLDDAPEADAAVLARRLMAEVQRVVPILPVSLAAAALRQAPADHAALAQAMEELARRLAAAGAPLALPGGTMAATAGAAMRPLLARGIAASGSAGLAAAPGAERLVAFYAAPVEQALGAGCDAAQTNGT
jgi:glycerol-3-phosphate O-acyltransferase